MTDLFLLSEAHARIQVRQWVNRLSPTADVPSYTSGTAICPQRTLPPDGDLGQGAINRSPCGPLKGGYDDKAPSRARPSGQP